MAISQNDVTKTKIDVRKSSRDLIQVIFKVTEIFPSQDPEALKLELRKKALSISSFISHGTAQAEKAEQKDYFIAVMTELRELLKLIDRAKSLNYTTEKRYVFVRLSISNVITSLDKLVKMLGVFDD